MAYNRVPFSGSPTVSRPSGNSGSAGGYSTWQPNYSSDPIPPANPFPHSPPRATGNYAAAPEPPPATYRSTPITGQPLSKVRTIADFLAEQRAASSPQPRPEPSISRNRPILDDYTPPPYRNTPTYVRPREELRTIGDWLESQRTASSPPAPIPSPSPALNPRNLTRAVPNQPLRDLAQGLNRSVAPARRALAPLANRLAPVARGAGNLYRAVAPALPYIAAGLDFVGGLESGESVGRSASGALGGLGGGIYGAQLGAAIGTGVLPGVGTVIGGILGGAIGGFGGGWLADRLHDTLFPNSSVPSFNDPFFRGPAPPFYGGQSATNYRIRITQLVIPNNASTPYYTTAQSGGIIPGPLSGFRMEVRATTGYSAYMSHYLYISGSDGIERLLGEFKDDPAFPLTRNEFVRIEPFRVDGLPDTGGDPAVLPGTPDQLALAPLLGTSITVEPPSGTTPDSPLSPTQLSPASPTDPLTPQNPAPTTNPLSPSSPTASNRTPALGQSPSILDNPLLPLLALPLAVPNLIPSSTGGRGSYPQLWRPPSTTSQITTGGGTTGSDPTGTCRFAPDTLSHQKLDRNFAVMEAIQVFQTGQLLQIQDKLGEQLPNGGLSAYVKNFWKWSQMDRIMNLLTMWTTIHNAMMLSNNITQTLFSGFDMIFQVFDFSLKDDEEQDISTGEWVGSKFNDFLGSIFGDQNVAEVRATWNRANRIYQAAANIHNAMQSIMYSLAEAMEVVGNYVAFIGNAAKKYGVFLENAYGWMTTGLNFRQNKFLKRLEQIQEGVEAFETVSSEVLNVTEMFTEIQTQSTELKNLLREENAERTEAESVAKGESVYPRAPLVQDSDLVQPIQE